MARHRKKKKNRGLIALTIVLVILVALLAGIFLMFRSYYGLSNYVSDTEAAAAAQQAHAELDADTLSQIEDTGLTDSEESGLLSLFEGLKNISLSSDSDIYNLLLIGVDRRDTSWNGNSDSMIVLSVNKSTKKIHMVSLMRDLYANIEGYGVRKLNAACAIGGPTLLVSTIEENYKIDIDNYACVDFASMADIIDILGGIELEVTAEEAATANGLVTDMASLRGIDPSGHYFGAEAGTYHADGLMAVAYSRIRHVGNSDYQRTERQRIVLTKLMEKVKDYSVTDLNSIVRRILPYITHNIDTTTMLSLTAQIPTYMGYTMEEARVPFDGMYTTQGEILVPTQPDTVNQIQEILNS